MAHVNLHHKAEPSVDYADPSNPISLPFACPMPASRSPHADPGLPYDSGMQSPFGAVAHGGGGPGRGHAADTRHTDTRHGLDAHLRDEVLPQLADMQQFPALGAGLAGGRGGAATPSDASSPTAGMSALAHQAAAAAVRGTAATPK